MRSSIACVKCRRSKIKCINKGTDTDCEACKQSSRDCTYPLPPATSSTSTKRHEHPSGLRAEGEAESKRPRRREPENGARSMPRVGDDPLETPPITAQLWREIFKYFQQHYYADLPFLHYTTFFNRISKANVSGKRSHEFELLLLGMLTLTARFVPELMSHSYPPDPNHPSRSQRGRPLEASEFYAAALEARLDAATMATPSLDTIQALLMLGVHNWGMCRGMRSWMGVGAATRMAYAMGLGVEDRRQSCANRLYLVPSKELARLGVKEIVHSPVMLDADGVIAREIRHRTMWSCFILDRYLSSGRARPQMSADTMPIPLPCSEDDFLYGDQFELEYLHTTSLMAKSGSENLSVGRIPILSIYIRLVEIWGHFAKWSCAGGRRLEGDKAPWSKETKFFELREKLDRFQPLLPLKYQFSTSNTLAHAAGSSKTLYTSIHTLFFLCQIVLHREYIPFIPLHCNGPVGPLDAPTFPKEKYCIPDGFWEESAELVFESAKNVMKIVRVNEERGFSIESPQVGFSIWTAAFVGVYAVSFPHMDKSGFMNGQDSSANKGESNEKRAIRVLGQMTKTMKMAEGWSKTLKRMREYYAGIINDHQRAAARAGSSSSSRVPGSENLRTVREGGHGGGLEEYKLLEHELKEFGNIQEDARYSTPTASDATQSRASTRAPDIIQSVERGSTRPGTSDGKWAAVNNSGSGGGGAGGYQNQRNVSTGGGDEFNNRRVSYPEHTRPQYAMTSATSHAGIVGFYGQVGQQQQQLPTPVPHMGVPTSVGGPSFSPFHSSPPTYPSATITTTAPPSSAAPLASSSSSAATISITRRASIPGPFPASSYANMSLPPVYPTPSAISYPTNSISYPASSSMALASQNQPSQPPQYPYHTPEMPSQHLVLGGSQVAGFGEGQAYMWGPERPESGGDVVEDMDFLRGGLVADMDMAMGEGGWQTESQFMHTIYRDPEPRRR